MGDAVNSLREERRKTLGDWVALCLACGHGQRYFVEIEGDIDRTCPTCGEGLILRCPACDARISSMFAVACEECDKPLRPKEQFGSPIRRTKPGRRR